MDWEALYTYGVYALFLFAAVVFPLLFFISAPYGRHRRKGWGPEIPATTAWVVMESPCVLVFAWVYLQGPQAFSLVPLLLMALWQAHYVQRTYLFPFLIRSRNRRTPIAVVLLSIVFNTINAATNAFIISHATHAHAPTWVTDPRFIAGVALFLIGYSINRHSDAVLRKLRGPAEEGYKIPNEGLHRYVASPNYLGEIIEWGGFALAAWTLPALGFLLFTIANLAPRARTHLRWYRETFPDYPKSRRALIPGIW